jgi:predicted transcriptional regulator of viral defense system
MEFDQLLKLVGNEPVFESSLLLAGDVKPAYLRLQLSRWVKAGKIHQLRRGVYALAAPYQKQKPHPFLVANQLQSASYVSLQSALSFYGMIPDIVHSTISVTTGRSDSLQTPLGNFEFRHIHKEYFRGYRWIDVGGQQAFVAIPEKAILDLIYLQPGGEKPEFIAELRLQNLDHLDIQELRKQASLFNKPKIQKSVKVIEMFAKEEYQGYEEL